MKICLINNLYKPFNRGGAEKVSETIVAGLRLAGHEALVITTKPRKQLTITNYELPPSAKAAEDKRIYYLNSLYYNLNKLPKIFRFFWHLCNLFNFVSYFKIRKILRAEKCDAVITNNLMGVGYLIPLAVRKLGIKHLHIAHDIQLIHPSGLIYYGEEGIIDSFYAKIYSNVCRWLWARPQVIIFPSRWLKDLYLKRKFFTQAKIYVLSNPLDVEPRPIGESAGNFYPVKCASRPNHRLGFNGVKFLFLGQIEKHKGVFLLIDAFNKIKEKYPEVELLLAGDGSQIELARRQAASNKDIKFLDWPGDEAADKLLFSSSCLVYPSLVYENCPNAIQRALAAGLPVLASGLGGIPELLADGLGILFKPAKAADLAEKMAWLIENRNNLNNLAEAGRRKASLFSVENYVKKLEELIWDCRRIRHSATVPLSNKSITFHI